MTIQDFHFPKKEVRILDSTHTPTKTTRTLIGQVCEVSDIDYASKTIAVYTPDKTDHIWFNFSDVQELTPLSHNDVRIGIGDTVNYGVVYGYSWYDGEWRVLIVRNNNWESSCWAYTEKNITSHTPLTKTTPEQQEIEAALKTLEKHGKIKDGKIII